MSDHLRDILRATAVVSVVTAGFGCDRTSPTSDSQSPGEAQPVAATRWQQINGSQVQMNLPTDEQPSLQAAIDQARATASDARQRWMAAHETDRANWAIKWAAPTIGGGVEHVWVRPTHWSEFRIEGVLDTQPIRELDCARTRGEPVSFPVEELSDWIYSPDGTFATTQGREGGFTLAVLDAAPD